MWKCILNKGPHSFNSAMRMHTVCCPGLGSGLSHAHCCCPGAELVRRRRARGLNGSESDCNHFFSASIDGSDCDVFSKDFPFFCFVFMFYLHFYVV